MIKSAEDHSQTDHIILGFIRFYRKNPTRYQQNIPKVPIFIVQYLYIIRNNLASEKRRGYKIEKIGHCTVGKQIIFI